MRRGNQAQIEIRNLSKVFEAKTRSVKALEDFELTISQNEFVSLIGPSGCGKTTLLRLLGGLIRPSSGEVLVEGRPAEQLRYDRQVGFVFQDAVLLPWRNVLENVELPLKVMGAKGKGHRTKCLELIKLVGLSEFSHSLPKELSGGMKQRVAIARALSYDPKILLMDEPFGALDDLTRSEMNLELLRIWERAKKTVVFVTHSISEAVFLSDRVVVFTVRPGRIREITEVSLPRPRNLAMRDSLEFISYTGRLRQLIHEERRPIEFP